MIQTAHTLIQARINQDKSNLALLHEQWKDTINNIECPLFKELAIYIKPNIDLNNYPLSSFYETLLNSQEESLDFTEDFLVRIANDNYLKIDDKPSQLFVKNFHKTIHNNNKLLCNLFYFYFEFNKPFFFSGFSTSELKDTHHHLSKTFVDFFSQGYLEFLQDFHHTLEENGEKYLYTSQRFFPAFFEYFRIISYVEKKFQETYPDMNQKELAVLNYIFQSVLQNESFFNRSYFFLINVFNETDSLNSLNELLKFSFSEITQMQLSFFQKPEKMNSKNFNIIQKHLDEIFKNYSLMSFYNPFIITSASLDEEDDKGKIGVVTQIHSDYSPILAIQHCYSIKKHLEKINSLFPFPAHINSSVIIGSHISRRFNEETPTACFSEVLSKKMINCHFETFKANDTVVLAHEYFHFIDNCLMKKIFFNETSLLSTEDMVNSSHQTDMQKNVFFNFSSIFHIEFQQIFSANSRLAYSHTPFEYLNKYPEYQSIYIKLFENFLYSISSQFSVNTGVIEENQQKINYLNLLTHSISSDFTHSFIDNFVKFFENTNFEDPYFTNISQQIISTFNENQMQFNQFIHCKLEQSIIPAIIAKIDTGSLPNLFSYVKDNYQGIMQDIDYRNIYEKEAFLIDLNNPSFDSKIVGNILFDISNFIYSTINLLVNKNPDFINLFGHKNLNASHRGYHLAEADSFLTNLVESLSLHTLSQFGNIISSHKHNLQQIKNTSGQSIDLLSVSTNSHLEKIYLPIPNIFNSSVSYHLSNSDANWSMYINHPSEILARSHSILVNLHKHLNSPLFFIAKETDNLSSFTKKPDTISLKDFSKQDLKQFIENYQSVLQIMEQTQYVLPNQVVLNEDSPFLNKEELLVTESFKVKKKVRLKRKKS